jgi:hypothetical protein
MTVRRPAGLVQYGNASGGTATPSRRASAPGGQSTPKTAQDRAGSAPLPARDAFKGAIPAAAPRGAQPPVATGKRPNAGGERLKQGKESNMSKRQPRDIVCPRCGVPSAKVIGRSESQPVIYLRCEDCGRTSIAPE